MSKMPVWGSRPTQASLPEVRSLHLRVNSADSIWEILAIWFAISTQIAMNPELCFVLMPFGQRANPFPGTVQIDFDKIYQTMIEPAVKRVGLNPLRADQEISSGLIHESMFERLLLCEYAIADLTAANPNVYYELGVRHAVRPWSTILICSDKSQLPFDVAPLRTLLYSMSNDGSLSAADRDLAELTTRLEAIRESRRKDAVSDDSPLFALLKQRGYEGPNLSKLQSSLMQRVDRCGQLQTLIAETSSGAVGIARLNEIQQQLEFTDENSTLILELFEAYRRAGGWQEMIALVHRMPFSLANAISVQEQFGMALGRLNNFDEAADVLKRLIAARGPSSLTYCFLGVVMKKWLLKAREEGNEIEAEGALEGAIDAFLSAFKLDPRMIFPGINSVLLLDLKDPSDTTLARIRPVVRYFIESSIASGKASFWEHSAELELAMLDNDQQRAREGLARAVVEQREPWMLFSTFASVELIRQEREKRGNTESWYGEIAAGLEKFISAKVAGA